MRVGLVVVQYYVSDRELRKFVDALCKILRDHAVEVEEVRVDIRARKDAAHLQYPFFDISGYCEGLRRLPEGGTAILLNDTFFVKHPWRSYAKALARVLRSLGRLEVAGAAGAVFPTQNLLLVDENNPTRQHVSTFLVALNPAGRTIFEMLASQLPGGEDPLAENWLSRVLSAHRALALIFMLHFGPEPNPWLWSNLPRVTDERVVQRKKVTVAFEYLLTCELLRSGGLVLPINVGTRQWLAEQVERLLRRWMPNPAALIRRGG